MTHTLIPVRTIRRPKFVPQAPAGYLPVPRRTYERIAVEVRAEIDVMVSQLPPFPPIEVPESGLCHGTIRETFQGHEIEYFCVQDKGHDGECCPSGGAPIEAVAEVLEVLPLDVVLDLDHAGAWGCLDAPVAT
jgi:hypothetical protein